MLLFGPSKIVLIGVPCSEWSGINALLYYGPTLVLAIGLSGETTTLFVAGGIGIVQLIAVLPAILFIDSVGRKKLLRGGSAVMVSAHLGIAILVCSSFYLVVLRHHCPMKSDWVL